MKIPTAKIPFDRTFVHPESYNLAKHILDAFTLKLSDLVTKEGRQKIEATFAKVNPKKIAEKLEAGEDTVKDIIADFLGTRPATLGMNFHLSSCARRAVH